ncbi:glycosyltransferase [Puniceicoccus vermicola]|uniref:Glycosyltransferase n=1 Tax=Puniceicoccus vermicola TaxID=388746 RepID=A0A7X1AWF4_9BACT|nr:glycosyltransferase [Puniceicoccus vermicola]
MKPSISIVTPTYQSGEYLEACILSIKAQKYPNLEYIIVDGGSTDQTAEIVGRHRDVVTHFISEPDKGMYDAINKGFALATGEVRCWLNSDDSYFSGALSMVGEIFQTFPDVYWITGFPAISTRGVVTSVGGGVFPREWIRMGLCNGKALPHITQETVFWRRECWDTFGPIPSDLKLAGDFWLWQRFSEKWDLVFVKVLFASFCRRSGQLSDRGREEYEREMNQIVEERVVGALDRRRMRLRLIGRLWWILRWIPKAKGLILRALGSGATSMPMLTYSLENGWRRRRIYLGEERTLVDKIFSRIKNVELGKS